MAHSTETVVVRTTEDPLPTSGFLFFSSRVPETLSGVMYHTQHKDLHRYDLTPRDLLPTRVKERRGEGGVRIAKRN